MTCGTFSTGRKLAITCRGLYRVFGDRFVLRDLELDVGEGRHVAVMGPSGSGKTTLLHILAGIVEPSSGEVVVAGLDVGGASARERAKHRQHKVAMVVMSTHDRSVAEQLDEILVIEDGQLTPLEVR